MERLTPPSPGPGADRAVTGGVPPALSLDGVAISYARPGLVDQLLGRQHDAVPTVADVSLAIRPGETFGLVGESGSGKSTILRAVAGLVPPRDGTIALEDDEPLEADVDRRSPVQLRRVQLVFQNPDESLNPRHTVADILAQPLRLYFGLSGEALRTRSMELLEQVRLGPHYLARLPGQLSGGEKQRVAIARAFAAEPELVLCDEVTSALDVSVQAAVLGLLERLRRERGTTYVFVSHDLAVVRVLADRVAVPLPGAALRGRPGGPGVCAAVASLHGGAAGRGAGAGPGPRPGACRRRRGGAVAAAARMPVPAPLPASVGGRLRP